MTIKALIPVRSGSVRVKNKNIRPFASSSLLEIKIKQLQRISELDGIVVNSNSDEMLDIATRLGAETVKRDEYFATSTVSINEVYEDIARHINTDVILFADATNPLIEDDTIRRIIRFYEENKQLYDSVITANAVKLFMWQNNAPLNYDENNKPRSQDLPNILALNFAVHIIPREIMIKKRSIVGYKPFLYEISKIEALDIDDQSDFEIAEFLYKNALIQGGGK